MIDRQLQNYFQAQGLSARYNFSSLLALVSFNDTAVVLLTLSEYLI